MTRSPSASFWFSNERLRKQRDLEVRRNFLVVYSKKRAMPRQSIFCRVPSAHHLSHPQKILARSIKLLMGHGIMIVCAESLET